MGNVFIDSGKVKNIFKQTLSIIDSNKHQIFDIAENVRNEYNVLKKELDDVCSKLLFVIKEVDMFEHEVESGRKKLYEVNKDFDKFSEEAVEEIYDKVNTFVTALYEKREEEHDLAQQRNSLEQRLKAYSTILADTERIISQISVAMNFLEGSLNSVIKNIDDMNEKSFLGIQIIEALEAERERVARDIHDGPAQSFANLSLSIELVKKLIDVDRAKAEYELDEMKKLTKDNLTEIRRVIYDLKPFDIADTSLIECIQTLIDSFKENSEILVRLKSLSKITFKNDLINMTVFRVVREAMNNIKKYSKATIVDIILEQTDEYLNVAIIDNGIGFDTKKTIANESHGFGLASIKRQCSYLQAIFDIDSTPGEGTRITIRIPLDKLKRM